RRRLGLPRQERAPGRVAAVADDRAQPLADAAAVHDLRSRPGPGDGLAPAGPATRVTKLAAAAAAGVRDAGDRAGAGLLRSPGQRGDRTRIRRVHGPLPAAAAL